MIDAWHNPIVIGLAIGAPSVALGYLGYQRSRKIDKAAEQAGIASSQNQSIGQVIGGLNSIITNLQNDNLVLRQDVEDLKARIALLEATIRAS